MVSTLPANAVGLLPVCDEGGGVAFPYLLATSTGIGVYSRYASYVGYFKDDVEFVKDVIIPRRDKAHESNKWVIVGSSGALLRCVSPTGTRGAIMDIDEKNWEKVSGV